MYLCDYGIIPVDVVDYVTKVAVVSRCYLVGTVHKYLLSPTVPTGILSSHIIMKHHRHHHH